MSNCLLKNEQEKPEMELTATREIISRLKAVKAEYELTIPRIKDMIESNGDFISLSTLRRVFADGSENDTFSYERTLAPIAKALLFQDSDGEKSDAVEEDRVAGLKTVILLKNEEIARLKDVVEHLEGRIEFLLSQIEKKDRRMDERDEIIKKLMEKVL